MKEADFKFRQFSIWQDNCAMKVGTDSVLLGAWAEIADSKKILDIGTGTGILALMAAQRNSEADITAMEIDPAASAQAESNICQSPWKDRVKVINADVRSYDFIDRYDALICNPPYFTKSLHSPDGSRNIARHDDTLGPDELASAAERLLTDDGELHLILPSESFALFSGVISKHGLQFHRITHVCTAEGRPPKRTMFSIGRRFISTFPYSISIRDANGEITDEYRNLVQDFYLKL